MNTYLKNLSEFKKLIELYTIADLKSMIYDVEDKASGGCCYPAVQTLFSLMEMIGKLSKQNISNENAFVHAFVKLGSNYNNKKLARRLYTYFRGGIAHTSLARSGVQVKKSGDTEFHLSNKGNNLDARVMFEEFLTLFNRVFDKELQEPKYTILYENNLKDVFKDLKLRWLSKNRLGDQTDFRTTISGTMLPTAKVSGPSTTTLKMEDIKK